MVVWWVALAMVASAAPPKKGPWRDPKPYIQPVAHGSYVSVNGDGYAILTGGVLGGVRARYRPKPHWTSNTRGSLTGSYGVSSGSLGADVRLGSFFGPSGKVIRYQVGPDLFYNGYGNTSSVDYQLAWAPGLDLRNTVVVATGSPIFFTGELTPGWVFDRSRHNDQVAPFHELRAAGSVVVRTAAFSISVGYMRVYNGAGITEGLTLGGGL